MPSSGCPPVSVGPTSVVVVPAVVSLGIEPPVSVGEPLSLGPALVVLSVVGPLVLPFVVLAFPLLVLEIEPPADTAVVVLDVASVADGSPDDGQAARQSHMP